MKKTDEASLFTNGIKIGNVADIKITNRDRFRVIRTVVGQVVQNADDDPIKTVAVNPSMPGQASGIELQFESGLTVYIPRVLWDKAVMNLSAEQLPYCMPELTALQWP